MQKIPFILAINIFLLCCLMSCSKNETSTPPSDTINFENIYIGITHQTKASSTIERDVVLGVSGFYGGAEQFNNSKLYHNDETNSWVIDPTQYWPIGTNVKMNFKAYAPYRANLSVADGIFAANHPLVTDGYIQASVTIPSNGANVDFMYGEHDDVDKGSTVSIAMHHALTKVQFKASTTKTSNVTIKSIELANVASNGYFNSTATPKWNGAFHTTNYTIYNDATGTSLTEVSTQIGSSLYLLPQTLSDNATVTIKGANDGVNFAYTGLKIKELGNSPVSSWRDNQSVTYALVITDEEITFMPPTQIDWNTEIEPETPKEKPLISSSFIQSWYFLYWNDARWQTEIDFLKSVGINEIIIDNTFRYYQESQTRKYVTTFPVTAEELGITDGVSIDQSTAGALERCLKNCEANGMKVYVGLNHDSRHWPTGGTDAELRKDMEIGNKVMNKIIELYATKYPTALAGWYWDWEVNNAEFETPARQELVRDLLNITLTHRTNNTSKQLPIILSPFMNDAWGLGAVGYGQLWKMVIEHNKDLFISGDLFAPQDGVGVHLDLPSQAEWMPPLKDATTVAPNLKFAINVENFVTEGSAMNPAKVSRVIAQLNEAAKLTDKFICFSYSHYYINNEAHLLYHDAYKNYFLSSQK